uniref:Uncharacterized protein n=1 Tax=Tupiella akineta TaxID=160070 RepID=Q6UVS9_TUPAK|nr:hypothetical protein PsakpMp33 [Tupiella akineta]AAQ18745.1 hypothetical protein [Tupiella akineta]
MGGATKLCIICKAARTKCKAAGSEATRSKARVFTRSEANLLINICPQRGIACSFPLRTFALRSYQTRSDTFADCGLLRQGSHFTRRKS